MIDYVIDGQNRRVGKKVNGVLVQGWLYQDALELVAELDGAGSMVARFVYGSRANVPDYMIKGGTTYRIVTRPPRQRAARGEREHGAVAQRIDYDEFGNVTPTPTPASSPSALPAGSTTPTPASCASARGTTTPRSGAGRRRIRFGFRAGIRICTDTFSAIQ